MIRTCVFDLGNVLLHFSQDQLYSQVGAVCGRSAGEIHGALFESGLQESLERGLISEQHFHQEFQRLLNREVNFDEFRLAASDIFYLNAPIVPVLDALKAGRVRLVLLSNTSSTHFEFIHGKFDVLQRFDDCVVSFRVGAMKPEAAIFEATLQAARCEPAECFYTDDIAEYVVRGRSFGMQAEVFTDVATLKGHLTQRGVCLDGVA